MPSWYVYHKHNNVYTREQLESFFIADIVKKGAKMDSVKVSTSIDLFDKKIEMIKFVRTIAALGLIESKTIVDWFCANCPPYIVDWRRITLLGDIAVRVCQHDLVLDDRGLFTVRALTTRDLEDEFNVCVTDGSAHFTLKKPYEFPLY